MMRVVQAHVDVSPHTPTAPIYIGGLAGSFCTATYSPLPCLSFVLCCAGLWCALGCSGLPACPHSWGRPTSGCPPPPTHPHPPPAGHLLEGCRGQQACGARWPCAVLPPAVSWGGGGGSLAGTSGVCQLGVPIVSLSRLPCHAWVRPWPGRTVTGGRRSRAAPVGPRMRAVPAWVVMFAPPVPVPPRAGPLMALRRRWSRW